MSKGRYIGTYITEEDYTCLRLESLLQNNKLGSVVRSMISTWFEVREMNEETQIERFANYLFTQWHLRYRETVDFNEYIEDWRIDLTTKHKLSLQLTNTIIRKCKELQEEKS